MNAEVSTPPRVLRVVSLIIDNMSVIFGLIAGLVMFAVGISTTYEAIARKIFNSSTPWIFPASLFIMVWFPFLAAASVTKDGRQIKVDLLFTRLSEKLRIRLNILNYFFSLVFIITLGYYGLKKCIEAYTQGITSTESLLYPQWLLDLVFPVTSILVCLQIARLVYTELTRLRTNKSTHGVGWRGNSYLVLSAYLCLIALGVYLVILKPMAGIIFLVCCLLTGGLPVPFALGCAGIVGLFIVFGGFSSLIMVPIIVEETLHNFLLLAIPMFIMGGIILDKIGVGERIFDFASKWLNFLPGGLAVATVIACALFSAMIGISTAVAATIGLVAIPPMLSRGYRKELAYGSVAGGALGILIPPSAGLIVYGFLTDSSVGVLFAAAVLPALVVVALFSIYVVIYCFVDRRYEKVSYTWNDRITSLKRAIIGLSVPVLILGGIYTGFFTPTEAAGVLVAYSVVIGLIYKKGHFKQLLLILKESALLGSAVMMIMVGAILLTHLVVRLHVADVLREYVGTGIPNWVAMILIMLLYLILGMFLDGLSITVLTVPILYPLFPVLGVDVIVFGVFLMMFIEIALLTPPVGVNLFMVQAITEDELWPVIKGNIPFVALLLMGAILLLIFPNLALWLPRKFGL
jgi:C4-dicarboxylate transporter DctM subunit